MTIHGHLDCIVCLCLCLCLLFMCVSRDKLLLWSESAHIRAGWGSDCGKKCVDHFGRRYCLVSLWTHWYFLRAEICQEPSAKSRQGRLVFSLRAFRHSVRGGIKVGIKGGIKGGITGSTTSSITGSIRDSPTFSLKRTSPVYRNIDSTTNAGSFVFKTS